MSRSADFQAAYAAALDPPALPERISLVYEAVSPLHEGEGRSAWLLRRRCDGAPFVVKLSGAGGEDLEEEFRLLSALHPALRGGAPAPADWFEAEGRRYLVRAYLPGETLEQHRERVGVCTEEFCVRTGGRLCALLERLHGMDPPVIHRDIKPENVVLGEEGRVCLIDYGIARRYDPAKETDTRFMGTEATAAPEQYGFAQTDGRTDLYALGMTLIWLLTGSYEREALAREGVSPRLRAVLLKCTDFSPEKRYQTAGDLRAALEGRRLPRARVLPPLLLAGALALGLILGVPPALEARRAARPVEFPSACLEAAVRAELEQPEGALTYGDLARVERLALVGDEAFGPESEYHYMLENYVDGISRHGAAPGDVSDLSLLADMPNLHSLYLCAQAVSDLSPLAGLPLKTLALSDNQITDLSPLAALTGLEELWLGGNPLRDLSPLAGLGRLRLLNLDAGQADVLLVDSLSPLSGLPLESLSLARTQPTDREWTPLLSSPRLQTLVLWSPPPEALGCVAGMEALSILDLGAYAGTDLRALAGCAAEDLRIHDGPGSLEGIQALPYLRNLGLFRCPVTDLSLLAGKERLETFSFTALPADDFTPLAGLPLLHQVVCPGDRAEEVERDCPGHTFEISLI